MAPPAGGGRRGAPGVPGPRPSPRTLWQAPLADVLEGRAGDLLNGPWKLLVLGERWLSPASTLNPEDIQHMVTTLNNSGLTN